MTQSDFSKSMQYLFMTKGKTATTEMIKVWYKELSDIPDDELAYAMRECVDDIDDFLTTAKIKSKTKVSVDYFVIELITKLKKHIQDHDGFSNVEPFWKKIVHSLCTTNEFKSFDKYGMDKFKRELTILIKEKKIDLGKPDMSKKQLT